MRVRWGFSALSSRFPKRLTKGLQQVQSTYTVQEISRRFG
jgi:hypothetical protein